MNRLAMKVTIIEDELPAAERLRQLLIDISPDIEVVATLRSYHESITWLSLNPAPDLLLMDIDLGDGCSMELVKMIKISCPIVFVTGHSEYWQEAFEINGIDYLLKPLRKERLQQSLAKLSELRAHFLSKIPNLTQPSLLGQFKDRFLVKRGSKFVSIQTTDVSYFFASHKLTFLVEKQSSKFALDQSLSDINKSLDPQSFFRVNRKYLVNKNAIVSIRGLPKSKMTIEVSPNIGEELIISSENSAEFKKWLGK